MTLRKRFTLFTIFWLIFILILFNIFVYLFMTKITTRSEQQVMLSKVNLIVENSKLNDKSHLADEGLLREFYNVNELIRIISPEGKTVNLQGSDTDLLALPVKFVPTRDTGELFVGSTRVLYMKVPLYEDSELIGMLEVERKLNLQESYMKVLVAALSITSTGAVLFAIFGTYWFTSRLTSPIQHMVKTMREIDRSGKLRQIDMGDKDESAELQQLIRAFNQMIERLDRTFAHQKQFVADASHELKTPLTVIVSYAGMLKGWGRDNENIRNEAIDAIAKEAERSPEPDQVDADAGGGGAGGLAEHR